MGALGHIASAQPLEGVETKVSHHRWSATSMWPSPINTLYTKAWVNFPDWKYSGYCNILWLGKINAHTIPLGQDNLQICMLSLLDPALFPSSTADFNWNPFTVITTTVKILLSSMSPSSKLLNLSIVLETSQTHKSQIFFQKSILFFYILAINWKLKKIIITNILYNYKL